MALAATTVWEVQTGGDDTNNAGAFDPGQTAGMFTDGAATLANTSAPVFTSASYNFVSGDVGAWVYVPSGTNWTPGWYKIASVAANAATLNCTIGQGILKTTMVPTTVVGCATVASPASATWSIDYSQQAAAQFTYADLVSAGTGLTVSSAVKPFGKQHVGNAIVITGGTNFNIGRYVIASVAAVTFIATVVGPTNITTGAGATGTGSQGGALASPAMPSGIKIAGNTVFIKTGTYSITSASTNVSGGCVSDATGGAVRTWEGYGSIRGDLGTAPTLQASGISTATLFATTGAGTQGALIRNLTVDGASLTAIRGFTIARAATVYKCTGLNCTNTGLFSQTSGVVFVFCRANGCSTTAPAFESNTLAFGCIADGNTVAGFQGNSAVSTFAFCFSFNNSGASSDGFGTAGSLSPHMNCTAYNNGRDGFRVHATSGMLVNCVAESNAGFGFSAAAATRAGASLINCAGYNNTSGNYDTTNFTGAVIGFVTGSASLFTSVAGKDFSLNTTASGGALLRGAGFAQLSVDGLTSSRLDIGAAQHADPVVLLRNQGMDGGLNG